MHWFKSLDQEARRFYVVSAAFLTVCALVVFLVINISRGDEPEVDLGIDVSVEDQASIRSLNENFIRQAGNFGLKEDLVKPDNVTLVASTIIDGSQITENFWTFRFAAYEGTLTNYISDSSPIRYSATDYERWVEEYEKIRLMSYRAKVNDIQVNSKAQTQSIGAQNLLQVESTVDITSTVTQLLKTANDPSWDGSYDKQSSLMSTKFKIKNVKTSDGWKIYDATGDLPFLLVTVGDPARFGNDFYNAQTGYQSIEVIKGKVPTE